jgi:hypothetical protein
MVMSFACPSKFGTVFSSTLNSMISGLASAILTLIRALSPLVELSRIMVHCSRRSPFW